MRKKQILLESAAALLVLLFLYASISKFLDFRLFTRQMYNQPFPNSWAPFITWFIPSLEILLSLALIREHTRMIGFIAALAVMSIFTLYTGSVLLHFFAYVPCSCGGIISNLTWEQHLFFNLILCRHCSDRHYPSTQEISKLNIHHQKQFRMKKIKWTIMSIAILLSVGGAMATHLHQDCQYNTQYYYTGTVYVPAGKPGIDYTCLTGTQVCSYYFNASTQAYTPCMVGTFYNGSLKSPKTGWAFKSK